MAQGTRRVTRVAVSSGLSNATERGGRPRVLPNISEGASPASPVKDMSGPPGCAVGAVGQSLASSMGGSEKTQKLKTDYAVGEGGRVVDVQREDSPVLPHPSMPSTLTLSYPPPTRRLVNMCPGRHPRKERSPPHERLTSMLAGP